MDKNVLELDGVRKYMNIYSEDDEIKERVSSIIVVREYKKKNGIGDSGYSDKIKSIFNNIDREITNIGIKKIDRLLCEIIQEKFKKVDLKSKKSQLSSSIETKFINFNGAISNRENGSISLSKIVINTFKGSHEGGE